MTGFICHQIKDKCWNWYDSYGEICVGCGCCSQNTLKRAKARLRVLKRMLYEEEHFDGWFYDSPVTLQLQRENHEKNLKYYKKQIASYKGQITRIKRRKSHG